MSFAAYKVIHVLGVLFVFTSLGALMLASREGVERGNGRKLAGLTHGIALLVVLVAGFGALARLGNAEPGALAAVGVDQGAGLARAGGDHRADPPGAAARHAPLVAAPPAGRHRRVGGDLQAGVNTRVFEVYAAGRLALV